MADTIKWNMIISSALGHNCQNENSTFNEFIKILNVHFLQKMMRKKNPIYMQFVEVQQWFS